MQIIDITIPISNDTPVWEGEEGVTIHQSMTIAEGADYNVSRCEMGLHAGTHIDAPFHVFRLGSTINEIPLERLIGPAQVIHIPDEIDCIDEIYLRRVKIENGVKKLIFKTSNSRFWDQQPAKFDQNYVALNTGGANYLAALDLDLVGIDYFSISLFNDLRKPHEILLNKKVVVLENVDLRRVEVGVYDLYCLPIKVVGTDGAPVRAVLIAH